MSEDNIKTRIERLRLLEEVRDVTGEAADVLHDASAALADDQGEK